MKDCLPDEAYICERRLWYKDIYVDINYKNNDMNKGLDYDAAINKMIKKIKNPFDRQKGK